MNPTVTIIMSTYNGEEYLESLLDSISKQKGVNIKIIARDDGSKDSTLKILSDCKDLDIQIVPGENLGPAKSFLQALDLSPDSDYYAYCDQDDIWFENKLSRGISFLNKTKKDKPALYMSTYEVVDQDLNLLFIRDMEYEKNFTLAQTLLFRSPSGCTMMFNHSLKEYLQRKIPDNIRMHDFWTLLVAEILEADLYTDDFPSLKYRQHSDNSVGVLASPIKKLKRLVTSALKNKKERSLQATELIRIYKDVINERDMELLTLVSSYSSTFRGRISLLKNKNFRWNLRVNLLFYISVILGIF